MLEHLSEVGHVAVAHEIGNSLNAVRTVFELVFRLLDAQPLQVFVRRVAEVSTRGAWFDLKARRVTAPPQALTDALLRLVRTEPFEQL